MKSLREQWLADNTIRVGNMKTAEQTARELATRLASKGYAASARAVVRRYVTPGHALAAIETRAPSRHDARLDEYDNNQGATEWEADASDHARVADDPDAGRPGPTQARVRTTRDLRPRRP